MVQGHLLGVGKRQLSQGSRGLCAGEWIRILVGYFPNFFLLNAMTCAKSKKGKEVSCRSEESAKMYNLAWQEAWKISGKLLNSSQAYKSLVISQLTVVSFLSETIFSTYLCMVCIQKHAYFGFEIHKSNDICVHAYLLYLFLNKAHIPMALLDS